MFNLFLRGDQNGNEDDDEDPYAVSINEVETNPNSISGSARIDARYNYGPTGSSTPRSDPYSTSIPPDGRTDSYGTRRYDPRQDPRYDPRYYSRNQAGGTYRTGSAGSNSESQPETAVYGSTSVSGTNYGGANTE